MFFTVITSLFYCTGTEFVDSSKTHDDSSKTHDSSSHDVFDPIRVTGQGYHRKLEIELEANPNALLKWEITPDFYVDVYELKRLGFEFRIDGGQTPFIEIGNLSKYF